MRDAAEALPKMGLPPILASYPPQFPDAPSFPDDEIDPSSGDLQIAIAHAKPMTLEREMNRR